MKNAGKGPKYISSAYVFPLKKSNEFVGYVTAAARSDWAPILEYSRATPPNALVQSTRNVAQQQGFTVSGNLLYHGGVKYGLELAEGKAMNLRNKQPQTVGNGISPVAMSFDNDHVIDEWRTLTSSEDNTDHSGSTDSISPTDIINPGGSDSDTIYGVPA
ncbi:hypothetical protein [Halomarina pelagica]|uniref:hypothetical protein n=1 Tax=Halomarina pelagica TaxID=2961599 RepID=UPI0020C3266B|nr:hypothetical protein [Halomarina sp. BND7]